MTDPVIKVANVSRVFNKLKAVDDISFELNKGEIVGFIGSNGSGKTTTMRMISSLDHPSNGKIDVVGYCTRKNPKDVRKVLGWMPDTYGKYDSMTVWEYLDFFARAYSYKGSKRKERVDDVMEFTELNILSEKNITTLSKGMLQRLCLGRALINDPDVLILDEPAAGLDPKARIELKRLLRILAQSNKTIFISSHILPELEDICNKVIFINQGKIIFQGTTDELKRGINQEAQFKVKVLETNGLAEWLSFRPKVNVKEVLKDNIIFEVANVSDEEQYSLLKAMIQNDFKILEFRSVEQRLEDVFVDVVIKSEKI